MTTIAAAIRATRSFEDTLEIVAEEARRAIGAASLSVSRWERDRRWIRTLVNVGQLGPDEQRRPVDETYALNEYPMVADVVERGRSYLHAVDSADIPPRARALLRALNKESDAAVPIFVDGRTWGELYATSSAGRPRLTAADVELLSAVASYVADGIAQAEYHARLSSLALQDPLTGLANRRAFDEALQLALGDEAGEVSLLMCDLDGLKPLNDTLGHAVGDESLIAVADALRRAAEGLAGALPARAGGDEFWLLLPGRSAAEARVIATALVRMLGREGPPLSLSCGIASTALVGRNAAALFRAADAAQYAAKRAGDGNVRVAEPQLLPEASESGDTHPRRSVRDSHPSPSPGDLAAACLYELDDGLAGASAGARLAQVARRVADAYDAAGWLVAYFRCPDSGPQTLASADRRGNRGAGVPAAPPDGPRPVPSAAGVGDNGALTASVAAATAGAYVVVVAPDEQTLPLSGAVAAVRLLALEAVTAAGPQGAGRRLLGNGVVAGSSIQKAHPRHF